MNKIAIEQFLALFTKPTLVKLEGQQLHISIDECDDSDAKMVADAIHMLQQQPVDLTAFSQYFSEIVQLPIYKPANPTLAILQVAKKYQLDAELLQKAFKQRR